MMKASTMVLSFLAVISFASSFTPPVRHERIITTVATTVTGLALYPSPESRSERTVPSAISTVVTATLFAVHVAMFGPSMAVAATDYHSCDVGSAFLSSSSSSQLVAARSGGRGGGRASSGGARSYSRPSSSYSSRPSTSTYRSTTTIIQPPPSPTVIVTPPPVTYGYSYGYNPLGGFGLGYTVGAIGNLGNEIQDMRQESEIQRSKMELEQSRLKEAELEARLRGLEAQQQQAALAGAK